MRDDAVLIQRYVEGLLTEEEAGVLHERLLQAPELAERLLGDLTLDTMLRESARAMPAIRTPVLIPQRRFTMKWLVGVGAVAALMTLGAVWTGGLLQQSATAEATTASVALLAGSMDAVWEADSMQPAEGAALAPGWLRLKSGVIQIEFYQGARVSLQAPAALRLISSGEAFCERGKLSAQVPPQAQGFRIQTVQGTVVDLGTSFGLDVGDHGADVHVFEGEVELHQLSGEMLPLKEGEAAGLATNAPKRSADDSSFRLLANMDGHQTRHQMAAFERWIAASGKINADSDLLLRFNFQDPVSTRTLRNHSSAPDAVPDGSIVGTRWTQGRWPLKRALEFRSVSDRVRASVPGELDQFTLAMRVRVDALPRKFNSLFMSEGWHNRQIHWQITDGGVLRLGVAGGAGVRHVDYDSPEIFQVERLGRWMHLSVSFDSARREIVHYVDGVAVAALPLQDASPVKIGLAELGNWNDRPGSERVAMRHLSGAIEEFAIWSRVLTPQEVRELAGL